MIPAKPFYLIRHGETEANVTHTSAGGGLDSPLTERGRGQAQKVADLIHTLEIKPTKVVHSPMIRAKDTATYINNKLSLLMDEIDDLKEHMLGEWEGQHWDEVFPHLLANVRPEGGENRDDFAERVKKIFHEILDTHDDPVMIVAHGGTFHSLLHLHDKEYFGSIDNCHLHYFEPSNDLGEMPWRIWQFDIEEDTLKKRPAPFCGSLIIDND